MRLAIDKEKLEKTFYEITFDDAPCFCLKFSCPYSIYPNGEYCDDDDLSIKKCFKGYCKWLSEI